MNLEEAVLDAMKKVIVSGQIEKAIESSITRAVTDAFEKEMSMYSAFGKALQKAIAGAVAFDPAQFTFGDYSELILRTISKSVGDIQEKAIADHIVQLSKAILAPAPEEIKLSALIEKFVEMNDNGDGTNGSDCISCFIDTRSAAITKISLDKESVRHSYQCDVIFYIADGNISGIEMSEDGSKSPIFIGPRFEFNRWIFSLYTGKTKIVVDETNPGNLNLYYPSKGD